MSETTLSLVLTILDPDAYYPIFIRFFEILSIAEIIALTRTCKRIQRLYQTLLPLQWNVDHTLQRFVSDSRRFRQQMGKNDSLISGGIALQYFERVIWKESDLDIYVQDGPKAKALAQYVSTPFETIASICICPSLQRHAICFIFLGARILFPDIILSHITHS